MRSLGLRSSLEEEDDVPSYDSVELSDESKISNNGDTDNKNTRGFYIY
jgi:hypothetical protein